MSKIIENVEDVQLLLSKYEWLKEQAERLISDYHFSEIENIEIDDDNCMLISYSTYCRGYTDHENESVPIKWLFLSDEELKKAKEEKKKEEEEIKRKQKELNEIFKKRAQEQKDREEYERLKKKFEV